MGDRVSIRFVLGDERSVVLFSHWGGREFAEDAQAWADRLTDERQGRQMTPLDRLEPRTVMVEFIRQQAGAEVVERDLYLGVDEHDGDNSDNGHFDIVLGRAPEDRRTRPDVSPI